MNKIKIRILQTKISYIQLRKHLSILFTIFLLFKMFCKTIVYYISIRLNRRKDNELVSNLMPFIFLYNDLKRYTRKDLGIKIGGNILTQCSVLDVSLTIPKLGSKAILTDFISLLKQSKYFKYSDYKIVKEEKYEVKIVVTKCIYCELLRQFNISELAPYLCKSDEIFLKNYHPKIRFILKSSIAKGDKYCDETYQWINSKI